MKSHLGLMLKNSFAVYMDLLMVPMMTSLRDYLLENHWDLLMVKCLALMKASNCE